MSKYLTTNYKVFYLQFVAHIGLIYQIFNSTTISWLITFFVYFIVGCFGLVMTYHRLLAHNSWPASSLYKKVGSVLGSYAGIGSPLVWTAIHRAHHKFVDTTRDPHSPAHKGLAHVQWLGMFDNAGIEHVIDMLRDKFQMFLHKHYFKMHILIGSCWILIDPVLFVAAYLAPMALLWEIGAGVNTINHWFGYKNKSTDKHLAYNNHITGYLFFGEGWHANHHDYPNRSNNKQRWWEFDTAGFFIKLLTK